MDDLLLPCVEIDPGSSAKGTIIWLHGLGADGHDFEPVVPELGLGPDLPLRFLFPHAPRIAVTINGGMVMPAWYDITAPDLARQVDLVGVRRSAGQLQNLIYREGQRGIPPGKIVAAGFSQGGAVALFAGVRQVEPLAGIVGLSCYLPDGKSLPAEATEASRKSPIFMAHGEMDPMVPVGRGEQARTRLADHGYSVEWHTYPMMHSVCLEQLQELGRWFRKVLG